MFKNLIGGEWVDGPRGPATSTPRTRATWSASTRRPTPARRTGPSRRRRPRSPAWASVRRSSASTCWTRVGQPRSWRAATSSGDLLAREEGKTLPEAIGEVVRAGNIFKFFAGEALRLAASSCPRCGRASAWRSRASRSASSASSRPGTSRSRSRPGRSRRRWPTATASCSSRPTWCPGSAWALAEILVARGLPAGRVQPRDGPRLARSATRCSTTRAWRHQLHRLGGDRPARCRGLRGAHGASSSSRWAARTRWWCSTTPTWAWRSNCAVQSAFFSTGQRCTASSRVIVTAGHPRPVRRRDGRAHEDAEGRRRAARPAPTSARWSTRPS